MGQRRVDIERIERGVGCPDGEFVMPSVFRQKFGDRPRGGVVAGVRAVRVMPIMPHRDDHRLRSMKGAVRGGEGDAFDSRTSVTVVEAIRQQFKLRETSGQSSAAI